MNKALKCRVTSKYVWVGQIFFFETIQTQKRDADIKDSREDSVGQISFHSN